MNKRSSASNPLRVIAVLRYRNEKSVKVLLLHETAETLESFGKGIRLHMSLLSP